jgi:hypothetical protein
MFLNRFDGLMSKIIYPSNVRTLLTYKIIEKNKFKKFS